MYEELILEQFVPNGNYYVAILLLTIVLHQYKNNTLENV